MQGGFFGVEVFFVLSGYLITSLLLAEWRSSESIGLGRFWARRARRLLPALFCLVIVVAIRQAVVGPAGAVPGFGADAVATLFYFANWHQIASGSGYFAQTALVSPLQHTWSLAIEEQFYVIWPILVIGVGALAVKLRRDMLGCLLVLAALGSLASAVEMALLFHGSAGLNRVYYGTDTRAQGLLAGSCLAIVLAMGRARRQPDQGADRRRGTAVILQICGAVGMAAIVLSTVYASGLSPWIYRGGFFMIDVAAVAVIVSATARHTGAFSLTRLVFEWAPLRWIGVISYGLYLWHFPLFLWLDAATTGLDGAALLALRLAVTLVVAAVSYLVIEQPVRQRRLGDVAIAALGAVGLSGALAVVLVATSAAAAVPVAPVPLVSTTTTTTSAVPGVVSAAPAPTCRVLLPLPPPFRVYATFHRCPPVRLLMVGDSVGLTLGLQLGHLDQNYGVLLYLKTILGCGFDDRGLIDSDGSFTAENAQACAASFATWSQEMSQIHPQVVLVEMGWWDSMDHLWNGQDVHLGQPAYDQYLEGRMVALGRELGAGGAHVVFLTIPWMDPPPLPNGSEPPAASASRHDEINHLLAEAVARLGPSAHVFDIAPYVTPSGEFQADVGGSICRESDGVHFYFGPSHITTTPTYCGEELQAALLPYLARLATPAPVRH